MEFRIIFCFLATLALNLVQALPNFDYPSPHLDKEWQDFKQTYKKTYTGVFELVKRLVWESNLRRIQKHNIEHDMGLHSFTLGVNEFTDLTNEEFSADYVNTGLNERASEISEDQGAHEFLLPLNTEPLPTSVDWRSKGYVTEVKDQETCNSCYAFAAIGAVEGQHFHKMGKLVNLSAQQLVDCSKIQGNKGCKGGAVSFALYYIKDKGISSEKTYSYGAKEGKCPKKLTIEATISDVVALDKNDEDGLTAAVAKVGPVAVHVDDSNFDKYTGGIYQSETCSKEKVTHSMLVVGYGVEKNVKYWILKNSRGTKWGEKGYMRILRGVNMCGVAADALYPKA